MEVSLTISSYRCFGRKEPARLTLRPGFTSLVGPNNAGKSAVLRFLWEFRDLFQRLSASNSGNLYQAIGGVAQVFNPRVGDPTEVFADTNDQDVTIVIKRVGLAKTVPPAIDRFVVTVPRDTGTFTVTMGVGGQVIGPVNQWRDGRPEDAAGEVMGDLTAIQEACASLANCYYIGPLRTTQPSASGTDYDSEVGVSLITKWRQLKLGGSKTRRRQAAEVADRIRGIFELREFDIDVSDEGNRLLATIDGQTYGYHELGSGLGHFSLALVNLAARGSRPSWVLIDEPENGLHPTLQAAFLSTLASFASEGLVFATHNYGLARRMSDQILVVRRNAQSRVSTVQKHEAVRSLAEFLGELGFSGYRDLGFDKILLVEGPTDVPAIGEMLKVLGRRENLVLLPLGGSDAINAHAEPYLTEVCRLSEHVAAVIDGERASESAAVSQARLGFKASCEKLGIRCHILERRSLENYLTEGAVREAMGSAFTSLTAFQSLGDIGPSWPKEANWRIASRMRSADLESTDLGKFLRSETEPTPHRRTVKPRAASRS
jgi:hypothetical protein